MRKCGTAFAVESLYCLHRNTTHTKLFIWISCKCLLWGLSSLLEMLLSTKPVVKLTPFCMFFKSFNFDLSLRFWSVTVWPLWVARLLSESTVTTSTSVCVLSPSPAKRWRTHAYKKSFTYCYCGGPFFSRINSMTSYQTTHNFLNLTVKGNTS